MAHSALLRTFGKHWMKPLTLVALLLPFLLLALQWTFLLTNTGAEFLPSEMRWSAAKWTHHYLGDTAIRILLVTLAISPLRDITGWAPIVVIRRRIGLAAFFYALLHLLAYVWLNLGWSMVKLWEDIVIRTYITFGMAALMMMIPLAITSNNSMIRRLGRKAWDRLHWLIYPLAILAVAHNILMQKTLFQPTPMVHATILALLLLWRVWKRLIAPRFAKPAPAAA